MNQLLTNKWKPTPEEVTVSEQSIALRIIEAQLDIIEEEPVNLSAEEQKSLLDVYVRISALRTLLLIRESSVDDVWATGAQTDLGKLIDVARALPDQAAPSKRDRAAAGRERYPDDYGNIIYRRTAAQPPAPIQHFMRKDGS